MARVICASLLAVLLFSPPPARAAGSIPAGATLVLLDRAGHESGEFVDGNSVQPVLRLGSTAATALPVTFRLQPGDVAAGECTVAAGKAECLAAAIVTLGWYWGGDGQPLPRRT